MLLSENVQAIPVVGVQESEDLVRATTLLEGCFTENSAETDESLDAVMFFCFTKGSAWSDVAWRRQNELQNLCEMVNLWEF